MRERAVEEMNYYISGMMIVGVCVLVLLIGALRRKKEWLVNFVFRAVTGTVAVFFLNGFLVSKGLAIAIGINPITVLTSGILGFPGLLMLYGINLYKIL